MFASSLPSSLEGVVTNASKLFLGEGFDMSVISGNKKIVDH